MWSHPPSAKRFAALSLVTLLLVNVVFAGTAIGAPQIWVSSASLEDDSTLVGESVDVEVQMHNNGDGGAITVDITANGSVVESERVRMDANSDEVVRIPISFDEVGTYEIKAEGKTAGTLEVTRFRASSIDEREDGRTALLRAGAVDADTELAATLPASETRSFDLRQVRMTASGEAFNRSVATYAPPGNASFAVPDDDSATVIGAVEMDSIGGVDTTGLRVALDRAALRDAGLRNDDVVVYRTAGDSFEALATEQVSTTEDEIVYEATTDGGSQFVVGLLEPSFSVSSVDLSTGNAVDGKRINLTAIVANDGYVTGEYAAEMRVDGETVDEGTISVPARGTATVALQHTVTTQGDYRVALGNRSVGSVVLTSEDASSGDGSTNADGATGDGTDAPGDGGSLLDAGPSLPSLDGVGVVEFGIGAGIVVVGGGLLLLLRR